MGRLPGLSPPPKGRGEACVRACGVWVVVPCVSVVFAVKVRCGALRWVVFEIDNSLCLFWSLRCVCFFVRAGKGRTSRYGDGVGGGRKKTNKGEMMAASCVPVVLGLAWDGQQDLKQNASSSVLSRRKTVKPGLGAEHYGEQADAGPLPVGWPFCAVWGEAQRRSWTAEGRS